MPWPLPALRRLRYPLLMASLAALVAASIFSLKDRFGHPVRHKPQAQRITLIHPPPPEPPPPHPEVKPEKPREIVQQPEPEPEPPHAEEPPPGEDVGVDAEGQAGNDAFGLVGKPGGRGLIGGGGGHALIWYGQQLQREVESALRRAVGEPAHSHRYTVVAKLWLAPDGNVIRAELDGSSGDSGVDDALKAALGRLAGPFRAPPANLPQPVLMRIHS